ncbi:MAG TPA: Gfo/Idh/MocA family oxidoreductase [Gaiellaceae bacterium]|jgi:predicted dehydrogenase|nr:Gfo/Idh/MocA family oxidoreductase [Gaiellaceae bacterium]
MAKLRLGVIGAGSWAVASHLPNFAKRRDDVEFVGVCRKGPELLAKIKDEWGFQMASEDYRDVIDAGLDICLVASPHGLHYEHAKAALGAGAHVLCEKPFTVEPEHAWDLVRTAEGKGLHLLLSYGWNYRPWVREAKRLMVEHGVGEIEESALQMASVTRELLANLAAYPGASPEAVPEEATWTDPRNGGGYGQAQLTHALGVALWLTGLRGEAAFALTKAVLEAPVEHHEAAVIRYDNGSIGTMAGGSCHLDAGGNRHQLEFRAIGSEGQLAIDLERDYLWLWRSDGVEVKPELEEGAFLYDCDGPPNALVDLALGKEVENCSPGELGARTVEILDAAYRSAASGQLEHVRR